MSKFRKRVLIGLKNIKSNIHELGAEGIGEGWGMCWLNAEFNRGKVQRDVVKYFSLYFSSARLHWDTLDVKSRKKWLKKQIKKLEDLETSRSSFSPFWQEV